MVQMESDVRNCVVERITVLLEKRIAGIMDANRRNYYGECAAYIAALGEVQESMGEMGAKQKLMTAYKDKYFRRNAFRGEMRNYGWIDIKKKQNCTNQWREKQENQNNRGFNRDESESSIAEVCQAESRGITFRKEIQKN